MNTDTEQTTPVPIGAVMSLLRQNTSQRDTASNKLESANRYMNMLKIQNIKTFGRLYTHSPYSSKYDVIDKTISFAIEWNMFIYCNSEILGIKTKILPYTNKKGQTFMAHYTIHNNFIEKADEGNTEPKYYNGNFSLKEYSNIFKKYINYEVETFSVLDDLFKF
jgi:hypothetical protein